MRVVPYFWSWEDLQRMFESHGSHVEYRGPSNEVIAFTLQVLQHVIEDGADWLHVSTSVADAARGRELGGSYVPLVGSVILHKGGTIEFTLLGNGAIAPDSFQPPALAAIALPN
jgi:hypothetical protein